MTNSSLGVYRCLESILLVPASYTVRNSILTETCLIMRFSSVTYQRCGVISNKGSESLSDVITGPGILVVLGCSTASLGKSNIVIMGRNVYPIYDGPHYY